ncbi:ABC transporter substrate-binding protein [Collimonas sp. PA-H2]|uniref:ABC transporter substrate-binding protein n=1 Tax=Collimonas sp. PA-H2 TaxID=1881062 RepID=UPI001E5BE97A|nr:ABC transporter substrate-binding protein [Collimonas sp. PA-H2]
MKRILCKCLAAFSLFLPLLAHAADTIVVGQAIDLSGPNADLGRDYVAGIKTYFDVLNTKGGINGRRIQYLVRDDRGQADLAVKAVAELIEQAHVSYLFGGVGDDVTRAVLNSADFKRSGLTLYAPLAGADYLKDARILFWRPSYQQEIRHIFSHFDKLGIKDIGIVYQESAASADAYQRLLEQMKESGLKLSGTVHLSKDAKQISKETAALAAAKPGFVIMVADTVNAGVFLKEFRKLAPQTFVAGSSLTNLTTLRQLAGGKAVEWTVFSQVVPNPGIGSSPIQLEHLNMMRKYRDEPVSALTLEGFAAAKTWIRLLQLGAKRAAGQPEYIIPGGGFDIGGYMMGETASSNHLSNYVDIALFNKASGLTY